MNSQSFSQFGNLSFLHVTIRLIELVANVFNNGNQFLMTFTIDVTPKMTGQRMQMLEFGLYTVENGKIVEERFFYAMG